MLHFHPSRLQAGGKSRGGEKADQQFGSNCKCFSQQRRHINRKGGKKTTFTERQTWVQVPAISLITCESLIDCGRYLPDILSHTATSGHSSLFPQGLSSSIPYGLRALFCYLPPIPPLSLLLSDRLQRGQVQSHRPLDMVNKPMSYASSL